VVSVLTILFPDHMNTYASMEEYIEDKKVIFQEQDSGAAALFNHDDPFQADFHRQTAARALLFSRRPLPPDLCGAFLVPEGGRARLGAGRGRRLNGARESEDELILPRQLRLCGEHNRLNLLASALALSVFGVEAPVIREAMGDFGGVEHRLELFAEHGGVRFYNDSAATVPEAAAEALRAVPRPVVLIAGGTDKKLDFSPLLGAADIPERIVLLEGSGSEKIVRGLEQTGRSFEGPFSGLQAAVDRALELARPGGCVLFSPGCTSFEMFENEFDRGARFKAAVSERIGEQGR